MDVSCPTLVPASLAADNGPQLKAAQAGFFVRASRCVSSSVGPEPTDRVARPTPDEEMAALPSPTLGIASIDAAVADAGIGVPGGSGIASGGGEASNGFGVFSPGVDDHAKAKGKWRKTGDRDSVSGHSHGRAPSESKRRRSSGWFRRLTLTFQSGRDSLSDDFPEGAPSPLLETAESDSGSVGDAVEKLSGKMTVPAVVTSAAPSSTARLLFPAAGTSEPAADDSGAGAGADEVVEYADADAEVRDLAAETPADTTQEDRVGLSRAAGDGGGGGGVGVVGIVGVETDGEESDYETGSNTTEGFGSDDAGDLWDGGRVTGLFDRSLVKEVLDGGEGGDAAAEAEESDANAGEEDEAGAGVGASLGCGVQACAQENMEGVAEGSEEPVTASQEPAKGSDEPAKASEGAAEVSPEAKAVASSGAVPALEGEKLTAIAEAGSPRDGSPSVSHVAKKGDASRGRDLLNDLMVVGDDDSGLRNADFGNPPASVPNRTSRRSASLAGWSAAPASVLPTPSQATLESPLPAVIVDKQSQSPLPKATSSPAISEGSSSRESPRAWRLSWWARASDRHRPPPPAGGSVDDDERGEGELGVSGSALAAALTAAAAGGGEATKTVCPGGAFAPSFNGGDTPAAGDGREGDGDRATASSRAATAAEEAAAEAVRAAVSIERRARSRSARRRRLQKPVLAAEKLADPGGRVLEAAAEYLNVAGLGRASGVCKGWRERLGGESGARQWMRCVRLVDGVPARWRARLYLHVLYDKPSWVPWVS